jgi:hypothetical protein
MFGPKEGIASHLVTERSTESNSDMSEFLPEWELWEHRQPYRDFGSNFRTTSEPAGKGQIGHCDQFVTWKMELARVHSRGLHLRVATLSVTVATCTPEHANIADGR